MKKLIVSSVMSLAVVGALSASETLNIHSGWQLLGSSNTVQDVASTFSSSNIKTVWIFDDTTNSWRAYSPDSNLMQSIQNSDKIGVLNSIGNNKGFWVYATGDGSIVLGSNGDANTAQTPKNFAFVDSLANVDLSTFANKTFKVFNHSKNDDNQWTTFTFDSNGHSQIQLNDNYNCSTTGETNSTTPTMNVAINNGLLKISDNSGNSRDYKILAQNDKGVVLGATDVGMSDNVQWHGMLLGPVVFAINADATEEPKDMGTISLPYKAYHHYDYNRYTEFDQNGSVVDYYNGNLDGNERGSFEIVNGKLDVKSSDNWNGGGYENDFTLQSIYTIGKYSIDKLDYNWSDYNTVVYYNDDNGSSSDFNLTANPDVDTWQELFAKTNWRLNDTKYYENNNTTNHDENFSISSDGKVLSIVDGCGHDYNRTIESGKIYDNGKGIYIDISSPSPIYKALQGSSDTPNFRVNTKRDHFGNLPPYIKKAILRDKKL